MGGSRGSPNVQRVHNILTSKSLTVESKEYDGTVHVDDYLVGRLCIGADRGSHSVQWGQNPEIST